MPDFFRGKPATPEMLGNRDVLLAWIGQVGTFEIVRILSQRLVGGIGVILIMIIRRLSPRLRRFVNCCKDRVSPKLVLLVSAGVPR